MIVGEVPFEVPVGPQNLLVTTATATTTTATSAAFSVTVASGAPALFSDLGGLIVQKSADYSRVGPANPARTGDILIFYATGLGQTAPVGLTGVPASVSALASTQPVTVSVGGQNVTVIYSLAAPGYVALDQIAVQILTDMQGNEPVVIRQGDFTSAPLNLVSTIGRATQLDPQVQAVYTQYLALGPRPVDSLPPGLARLQPSFADAVKALLQSRGQSTARVALGSVMDTSVPGAVGPIPARVYTPAGAGPFPVIVYFHGGGFVIATPDTYDASARALANAARAIVVAVEYRKAPENRFPAAVEDAYAATQWVMNNAASLNGLPGKVAVAGESAGGDLATVVYYWRGTVPAGCPSGAGLSRGGFFQQHCSRTAITPWRRSSLRAPCFTSATSI